MTKFDELGSNIERLIRGKRDEIDLALVCLVSEGHLLLQDVPGVGKTTLAKAIAQSVQLRWSRIQFTPDLLPSDITGVSVFDQRSTEFVFRRGPVFANIVVADEINRGSPKTQSALLEVMEERQVSVEGTPNPLDPPFMVIATQNPVDMDGTYALPEAQLDRFLMRISMGYPDYESEVALLSKVRRATTADRIPIVASAADLEQMMHQASEVQTARPVVEYVADILRAVRGHKDVRLGPSPRAGLALLRAVRARAAADARGFVLPEDIKALAVPVLAHRLLLVPEAELEHRSGDDVIREILQTTAVPRMIVNV